MIVSSPSMSHVYSPPPSVRVPIFDQLLPRLLHCWYESSWQAQMGEVIGLGALLGKVTVETLCVFQVRVVRGFVFVLKRLHDYAAKELEETCQVFSQVLRVVNNVDEANSEAHMQSFYGVVEFLASELLNTNATVIVSKIVQCLALLASITGSEVFELLERLYHPLLSSLLNLPLRSKNVDQQVHGQGLLNLSGPGDCIEAQRLGLLLFYGINVVASMVGTKTSSDKVQALNLLNIIFPTQLTHYFLKCFRNALSETLIRLLEIQMPRLQGGVDFDLWTLLKCVMTLCNKALRRKEGWNKRLLSNIGSLNVFGVYRLGLEANISFQEDAIDHVCVKGPLRINQTLVMMFGKTGLPDRLNGK
ncbi:transformation/transcription domain-associated protein-like protein isoform X2 [Tanacetum coccineum]